MSIRSLLVPTDFSEEALASLRYALALAKDVQAKVYVLNSYYIPINTIEASYVANQGLWLDQSRKLAEEEMKQLEARVLAPSGVHYECLIQAGPDMTDINGTIVEEGISLVVLGVYPSGRLESFFGNLYTQAIRNAKAPVLLLPEHCRYSRPQKVVFATDLKPISQQKPLENLRAILQQLQPGLELLHVHAPDASISRKKQQELEQLQDFFEGLSPKARVVEAAETEEGIVTYAQINAADWIMAVAHDYGLLEGLFHSSRTKKLARTTTLPLLVSHE